MTEKELLAQDLRRISRNGHNLAEGDDLAGITRKMTEYIGDPDPELRDELIYETFGEWICEKRYYREDELLALLTVLSDENHLFYHIGNDGDETVFTRSFSVLVIVLILICHRERRFLDHAAFTRVKDSLVQYYQRERDLRGYVEGYGWAHAAAHGSDAFEELVRCEEMNDAILQELLASSKKVLYNEKYILCNEEDERIARMIGKMISNPGLSEFLVLDWIRGLTECCGWEKTRAQYIARVNSKNLVRCLYFRSGLHETRPDFRTALLETEKNLNRFSRQF